MRSGCLFYLVNYYSIKTFNHKHVRNLSLRGSDAQITRDRSNETTCDLPLKLTVPEISSRDYLYGLQSLPVADSIEEEDTKLISCYPLKKTHQSVLTESIEGTVIETGKFRFKMDKEDLMRIKGSINSKVKMQQLDENNKVIPYLSNIVVDPSLGIALENASIEESNNEIIYRLEVDADEFKSFFASPDDNEELTEEELDEYKRIVLYRNEKVLGDGDHYIGNYKDILYRNPVDACPPPPDAPIIPSTSKAALQYLALSFRKTKTISFCRFWLATAPSLLCQTMLVFILFCKLPILVADSILVPVNQIMSTTVLKLFRRIITPQLSRVISGLVQLLTSVLLVRIVYDFLPENSEASY